ncbi:MAG: hypothetical protein JSW10_09335, partial [Pseudomonadota bacterium]
GDVRKTDTAQKLGFLSIAGPYLQNCGVARQIAHDSAKQSILKCHGACSIRAQFKVTGEDSYTVTIPTADVMANKKMSQRVQCRKSRGTIPV